MRERRQYILLFLLLFLPYSYVNHSDGWNQMSRLAALRAMTIKGTLNIDAYHQLTGDKAFVNGHYYSEKAPAMTIFALPSFATVVFIQKRMGLDPDDVRPSGVSQWISTALSVGLIVALGGVAFFALIRNWMTDLQALIATLAIWLGTLAFPYATALFAHAGTAGLLSIALWGALDRNRSTGRDYIAGVCAGLAIASEYPAFIAAACLGAYVLSRGRDRFRRFAVAALPGLALIALNNFLITGSPLRLAYGTNPVFPTEGAAHNFGHGMPSAGAAAAVLFGQYRGLFFWNPVLLMAIPGVISMARVDRRMTQLVVVASALCLLQVASFHNWFGGHAIGPRYLLYGLPFLSLAAAFGIARFPKTGALLGVLSVVMMAMVTSIGISPDEHLATPLRDYYFWRIQHGAFANNLGLLMGLWRTGSAVLLLTPMVLIAWRLFSASTASATPSVPSSFPS